MSQNGRIAELYANAYEGESVGVYVFDTLARHDWGVDHVQSLEAAREVEVQTRDLLLPLLASRSIVPATAKKCRDLANEYAAGIVISPWAKFCNDLVSWSDEAMSKFTELRDLLPVAELAVAQQLIDHETALIAFAQASATGDDETARQYLVSHMAAYDHQRIRD